MTYKIYTESKYKIIFIIALGIYMYLYTLVDFLGNKGYDNLSIMLVGVHIFLNLLMSSIAAHSTSLVYYQYKLTNKESNASLFAPISLVVGMLTYGCSGCTIALLSSVGISYTVRSLPFANLPYKLLALAIVAIGYLVVRNNYIKGCKIKL